MLLNAGQVATRGRTLAICHVDERPGAVPKESFCSLREEISSARNDSGHFGPFVMKQFSRLRLDDSVNKPRHGCAKGNGTAIAAPFDHRSPESCQGTTGAGGTFARPIVF